MVLYARIEHQASYALSRIPPRSTDEIWRDDEILLLCLSTELFQVEESEEPEQFKTTEQIIREDYSKYYVSELFAMADQIPGSKPDRPNIFRFLLSLVVYTKLSCAADTLGGLNYAGS